MNFVKKTSYLYDQSATSCITGYVGIETLCPTEFLKYEPNFLKEFKQSISC